MRFAVLRLSASLAPAQPTSLFSQSWGALASGFSTVANRRGILILSPGECYIALRGSPFSSMAASHG